MGGVTWSGPASLPSVIMTASLWAAAHHREMPSLAEVGRSTTPGDVKLSLPDNPSRIPGRRTASIGWSMASTSKIWLNTPGHLVPRTRMVSRTLQP